MSPGTQEFVDGRARVPRVRVEPRVRHVTTPHNLERLLSVGDVSLLRGVTAATNSQNKPEVVVLSHS